MIVRNAAVLRDDAFVGGDLFVEGGRFAESGGGEVVDASGLYAVPGLVDIHLHGCVGYDFCDGTQQAIAAIAEYQAANGVTAFCPATMTLPEEQLLGICREAAAYTGSGAILAGITMEGPFFNAAKKGAQNAVYLREPDYGLYQRMQAASGGMLRVACVAPELSGAMAFIRQVVADGCRVSIAHTAAAYDVCMEAAEAGARHVTHLFNAMTPFSHRAPGVLGAAFDSGMMVELICDGFHLHPSVVRAMLAMFGPERTLLISDSMMAAGLGNGVYSLGGQEVRVREKRALLRDGTIAGSAHNLMDCLRAAVSFGIPLPTAVRMASGNPARAIGRECDMGSLEKGRQANFVLLEKDLRIAAVYIRGRRVA